MSMAGLAPQEKAALLEALVDEHKAWSTYHQVIWICAPVRPFVNISESEARHIATLSRLFERSAIAPPPNPEKGKVPRYASVKEAPRGGRQSGS